MVIGGVEIPFSRGLEGHSDADVLLHAIADAVLGALALGDIGTHFPDTDARYKDCASAVLLAGAAGMARRKGYSVANIDAVIIAEAPKMAPHIEAMRKNAAGALGCSPDQVGIKATTTEGMGYCGKGEGIAAMAVACMEGAGK